MAIIILNVSEQHGLRYGTGEQVYSLRINDREMCKFRHDFEDGLAECLRSAAEAFEYVEKNEGRL